MLLTEILEALLRNVPHTTYQLVLRSNGVRALPARHPSERPVQAPPEAVTDHRGDRGRRPRRGWPDGLPRRRRVRRRGGDRHLDGKKITVRNLLGHTSGLPDYTEFVEANTATVPSRTYTAKELLAPALRHKAVFPAGKRRQYSNTNYIVAGMLVERVTRKPVGEAVTERVIERLGLKETYWPEPGDKNVRKPRMEGYIAPPGGELKNATEMDRS
ncbi:serine hydrolase domain-containing protein [Streptomyces sp. NPDC015032]|uniref:serine hydrolase domain-containing protein n=1 Tax=Streptomyces sp. NPDC015032 TaxID=3364937 RepID=UPI0036F8A69D